MFKNFIALDVYSSANHFHFIVGNYCKHDKSDRLKKKKKEKKSFEYYNIIQNNEMIIAIYK